ncbi:MAG: hypothetical protein R3Y35_07450 [Clostridia bacterium]
MAKVEKTLLEPLDEEIYPDIYVCIHKSELENFKKTLIIKKGSDGMCWVCNTITDLLDYMEITNPEFIESDYIILNLEDKNQNITKWYKKLPNDDSLSSTERDCLGCFYLLTIGKKGNLKVKNNFTIMSVKKAYDL